MNLSIRGQTIEFGEVKGKVLSTQFYNQVWSSGGGGYVSANYGGYIEAPVITTTNWQRLRIEKDDGAQFSADIPGNIAVTAGDLITLATVRNDKTKKWMYCGLQNWTTRQLYNMGKISDIWDLHTFGLSEWLGKVGMIKLQLIQGYSFAGAAVVLFMLLVESLPLSLSVAWLFGKSTRYGYEMYWGDGGVVGCSMALLAGLLIIKMNRFGKVIGTEEERLKSAHDEHMQRIVRQGQNMLATAS